MKKLIGFCGIFVAMMIPAWLHAISGSLTTSRPDIVGYNQFRNGVDSATLRIDYYGNILPGWQNFQDIGESTHAWRRVYSGSLDVSSGITNVHEYFSDVPSSNAVLMAFAVSTATLVRGGTTFASFDLTQNVYPRTAFVRSTFTVGIGTSVFTGNATFYGVNNLGSEAWETIAISTTGLEGNVAWATISSITITITSGSAVSFANATLNIGNGNRIGLCNIISASSDVYKITEAGSNIPLTSVTVSTTNHTIQFSDANAPNGTNDFSVWFRSKKSPQ